MSPGEPGVARGMAPRVIFVAKFGLAIIVLYVIVALNPVNDRVIVPFTEIVARSAAALLRVVDSGIQSTGTVISSPTFAIDVRNGCNGIEAMILVCAAIFAFPATLRSRVVGLLAASVAIQILNVVRLGSLFWLGANHRRFFDLFHVAVWQSLIILAAITMFILWSWKFAEKPLARAR
ncbi:MAG TPA: exosortase H [Thermoanaerobaculia bacterium]|nr:exosortase H [Thermoanaerobaculia bacterium]